MEKLWPFNINIPTWLIVTVSTIFAYYKYFTWNNGIFKRLGIPGPKPLPVIGTLHYFKKQGVTGHDVMMREKYGKVVGTFQGRQPILLISDLDILKQIFVAEFETFTNHFVPDINDYPMRKFLTMIKDDHWKHIRSVVSPAFSSGRLRKMNDKIQSCMDTLLNNLDKKWEKNEVFDFREFCGAYTMDVIASVAFGLRIDSHNDPNNRFVQTANVCFQGSMRSPRILVYLFLPFLLKPLSYVKFSVFPKKAMQFFIDTIEQALAERNLDDEAYNDFLQLLIIARKQDNSNEEKTKDKQWTKKGITVEEALAQSLIFFLTGFETVANTLSLFAYSLATNADIQDKLIAEIDEVMKGHDRPTYDLVKNMPYLEMCLNETQRMYPAAARTDRVAKKDITINGLFIPKDLMIVAPIYVIHHDPDVWPDHDKFIPERFTPEEKQSRHPYSFIPFGQGPRNCVAKRLALMELKMAVVHILQNYKFLSCEETEIPLVIDPSRVKAKNGIKLKLEKRNTKTSS